MKLLQTSNPTDQGSFLHGNQAVLGLCLLILLLSLSFARAGFAADPPLAQAKPEESQSTADKALVDALLEFVGLTAQVNRTADTIATEVSAARGQCETAQVPSEKVVAYIHEVYHPSQLAQAARRELSARLLGKLSIAEKRELQAWIASPLGKKVYQAESSLQHTDPTTFSELETALLESAEWSEERQRDIYRILRATRIHHYVAALNTALSAAVAMGAACKSDEGSLNSIEIQQYRDRADEKLIAGLMLKDFIVPTGVILQSLDQEDLRAYFKFSVTEIGKKWYAAVIDTVRAMITQPIPLVRAHLTMLTEQANQLAND